MRKLLLLILFLPFFSCRTLNPSLMFKTSKDFTFSTDSANKQSVDYLIAPEDHLDMKIFTNNAFRLVDFSQGTIMSNQASYYLVEGDGYCKLPLIGRVFLKGMSVRQAEKILEEKYSVYFVTPFVMIRILNRQVLVFPGDGGTGTVINLQNENTSLLEALTMAGGVHSRGKAYKIKLIRGDLKNPQIFAIDLSTVEGMKKSNLTVQAKDIIYVEPSPDYSSKVLAQLTPYIGILTTILLVVNLLKK
jgi:polysaccharide export outer membrane protein